MLTKDNSTLLALIEEMVASGRLSSASMDILRQELIELYAEQEGLVTEANRYGLDKEPYLKAYKVFTGYVSELLEVSETGEVYVPEFTKVYAKFESRRESLLQAIFAAIGDSLERVPSNTSSPETVPAVISGRDVTAELNAINKYVITSINALGERINTDVNGIGKTISELTSSIEIGIQRLMFQYGEDIYNLNEALEGGLSSKGALIAKLQASLLIQADLIALTVGREEFNAQGELVLFQQTLIQQTAKSIRMSATKRELNVVSGLVSEHTASLEINSEQIRLLVTATGDDGELSGLIRTLQSEILVQAGQIALKSSQTDLNVATGRITTAEAAIVINSDSINTKVSKGNIVSEINQSPEAITISAEKINLNGALTINAFTPADKATLNETITKASTAQANAVSIAAADAQTKATAAQTAAAALSQQLVEAIRIGGRNYFSMGTPVSTVGATIDARVIGGFDAHGTPSNNGNIRLNNVLVNNGWYTIGFDARNGTGAATTFIDFNDGTVFSLIIDPVWRHFEFSFNVYSYTAATYNFIDISGIGNQNYSFRKLKVEQGNKGSDWTPATEDVDAAIAQAKSAADAAQQAYTNLTNSLKAMAYLDVVELAKLGSTVVEGGYLRTVLLDAAAIRANIINAEYIRTLELNADKITSGTISAARIDVTNLVASNIKTAPSGKRIEVTAAENNLRLYGADNVVLAELDDDSARRVIQVGGITYYESSPGLKIGGGNAVATMSSFGFYTNGTIVIGSGDSPLIIDQSGIKGGLGAASYRNAKSISMPYTFTDTDAVLIITSGSGTITLPSGVVQGREITLRNNTSPYLGITVNYSGKTQLFGGSIQAITFVYLAGVWIPTSTATI
jgi:hypothetical protein